MYSALSCSQIHWIDLFNVRLKIKDKLIFSLFDSQTVWLLVSYWLFNVFHFSPSVLSLNWLSTTANTLLIWRQEALHVSPLHAHWGYDQMIPENLGLIELPYSVSSALQWQPENVSVKLYSRLSRDGKEMSGFSLQILMLLM